MFADNYSIDSDYKKGLVKNGRRTRRPMTSFKTEAGYKLCKTHALFYQEGTRMRYMQKHTLKQSWIRPKS